MAISSAENAARPRATAPTRRRPRALKRQQPRKVGREGASGDKRKTAGKALIKRGSRARQSESEEKFAIVFEKAAVPMALARLPNGEIVDVNEEWVKLFGFTKKEAAGKTGFQLRIARDLEERRRVFRKIQKGAFVRCDQRQLFNKRGQALIVDCNVKSVTLDGQRYALSTMRDITERRRAEADLAYHAYLLENVHDAVIGTDERLVVMAWNKGAERMYGWRVDEALGRQLWELVPVDLTQRERARGLRELKKTGRLRTEAITYRKDGTPVHVEGITMALGWEKRPRRITGYVNIRRDISERKRAEEALRASEERFRRYFDLGLIGMAITSPSKGILEVNDELCRSLGYEREELLQKSWLELTHPDDVAADLALFERALAGKIDGYSLEKRWIRKDGRVIHSLVTAKCQRRPDRSVDYFVGLLLDTTDRKRAEERLREYEKAVEGLEEIITVVDRDYRYRLANRAFLNYRGLKREELEGRLIPDLLDKGVWEQATKKKLDEAFGGKVVKYELRYNCPQIGQRDLWISYFPIEGPTGVDRVACVFQDVTERNQAEEALRRSQANLAAGERISHTGTGTWNVKTGKVIWSDEMFRIFGLQPGSVTPSYELFFGIVHPEDRAWLEALFAEVVAAKCDYDVTFRVVRTDGVTRWIHSVGHPSFDKAGEVIEVLGTIMDVTERKEAKERLSASEKRFGLLAETLPQQVWSYAPDGSGHYFNRHWLDYTGISAEEARRSGGHEIVHPDDVAGLQKMWRQVAPEKKSFEMEVRLRRKDGEYRRFFIEGAPLVSDAGELLEWHGTNTDIEDRKRAEEALQQAQAKLEKVAHVSAMGEMAAAIAHEINQPLGAIVNNSAYCLQLLGNREAEAKKRAALEDIANDANRASAIIARIRGLTNGSVPEITKLNFRNLITEVVTLARRGVTEHRIEVKTAVARDLPRMSGDRVHLQQVLLNLVVNAIEAMSGVDERARLLTIRAVRTTLGKQPAIAITVADTGAGFAEELAEQMFDAFYSTKTGGMGMGLRISRTIADGHGGRLSAKRNDRGGATFSLVLPASGGT